MQSKLYSKNFKLAAVGATTVTLSAALAWYLYRRSNNNRKDDNNNNNNDGSSSSRNESQSKSLESSQARAGAASIVNNKSAEILGSSSRTANTKHLNERDAAFRSSAIRNNVSYQLYILAAKGEKYHGLVGIEFYLDEGSKNNVGDDLFVDFTGEKILECRVNKNEITRKADGNIGDWDGNRLYFPNNMLRVGKNLVWIRFESKYTNDGQGFHSFIDTDQKQYTYTNFEPDFCHKWFPCFDQPDIKGSLQLNSLVPKDWTVIANEFIKEKSEYNPTQIRALVGESGLTIKEFLMNADNNFDFYVFEKTKNISTYLFAMIAGPYREIKCNPKSLPVKCNVPMSLYCRESVLAYLQKDSEKIFEVTATAINFYSDFFGYPFPFSKYDQIWCPEFNVGAMENVGAITFNDTAYIFKDDVPLDTFSRRHGTIVHELCHMWFGNLVTMKWWNDLWLNESFADCLAYYALNEIKLNHQISDFLVMTNGRKNWGYIEDQLSTTHPIAGEVRDTQEAESIFDGITYSKGQSVIRQLLWILTPEKFSLALKNYFNKYQYKNTILTNFIDEIKAVYPGGTFTIDEWVQEWICTAGLNECEVSWDPSRNGEKESLVIKQRAVLPEHPTLRHHKMKVAFFDENGDVQEENVMLDNKSETQVTYNGSRNFRAVLPNHQDQAFIKLVLDQHSANFFKQNVSKVKESINRVLIWKSFYDMVRDGKTASSDFIQMAINSLADEKDDSIIKTIFDYTSNCIGTWTPRAHREQFCQKLFEITINMLTKQENSIHRSLDLKSRIVSFAKTKEHIRRIYDWYHGKDEELKSFEPSLGEGWNIVEKVTKSKDFSNEEKEEIIKIQSDKDKSDVNIRKMKKLEAIRAEKPEERENLWKWYTDPTAKDSMYVINASMGGFNLDERVDENYVELFFSDIRGVFENRVVRFAENFYDYLFPGTEDFPSLLKRIESELSHVSGDKYSVFIRKLKDSRDLLNRKQRVYDCYFRTSKL